MEADGSQMRKLVGCGMVAVTLLPDLQQSAAGAMLSLHPLHRKCIGGLDAGIRGEIAGCGLPCKGKRKISPTKDAAIPAERQGVRRGVLRWARTASTLAGDILEWNKMPDDLGDSAAAAANLVVSSGQEETLTAWPGKSQQILVKKRPRSARFPTSRFKPQAFPPVSSDTAQHQFAAAQETPSPTTSTKDDHFWRPDKEEVDAMAFSVILSEGEDPSPSAQLQCDDLMVELSSISSPESSEDVYVALGEELLGSVEGQSKESNKVQPDPDEEVTSGHVQGEVEAMVGIEEKCKGLPDADQGVTAHEPEDAKPDVKEGRRVGTASVKVQCRKGTRKHLRGPRFGGGHAVRTLADIYLATGEELPAYAWRKKGKGVRHGPNGRQAVEGADEKDENSPSASGYGHTSAEGVAELSPSPSHRKLEIEAEHLPDLNVSLRDLGLDALAKMMEEETESDRSAREGGVVEQERVILEACPTDGSDELLAQTLLDLRGQDVVGAPWGVKHNLLVRTCPTLQLREVSGSAVVPWREAFCEQQPGKDAVGKPPRLALQICDIGEEGWGHGSDRVWGTASVGSSAALCLDMGLCPKELDPHPMRAGGEFLRSIPFTNLSPRGEFMPVTPGMDAGVQGAEDTEGQGGFVSSGHSLRGELVLHDLLPECRRKTVGMDARLVKCCMAVNVGNDHGEEGEKLLLTGLTEAGFAPASVTTNLLGCPTPADSSDTESDWSLGPTHGAVRRGHTAQSAKVSCRSGVLDQPRGGPAGVLVMAKAGRGAQECKRAPAGVLCCQTSQSRTVDTIVPSFCGSLPGFQNCRKVEETEDGVLPRLQTSSRRRARALQRIAKAGGVTGWLDAIGMKGHAEYLQKMTAEQIISLSQKDAILLGLRAGTRLRLMTAIWALYQK